MFDTTSVVPHPGEQVRGSQPLRAAATTVTYNTQNGLRGLKAGQGRSSGGRNWSYSKDRAVHYEETGNCSSEREELESG